MADGMTLTGAEPERGQGRPATAPDAVWAAARDDYLAGLSAPETCRRHGVGLSALRTRAAREGWRRADQPWTPRGRLDPDDEGAALEARVEGDLDRVELNDLSWIAFRRMMRAVMRGEAVEALRWRRVREAMEAEAAELDRFIEQEAAIRHMLDLPGDPDDPNEPNDADGPNDVDDAHCVFSAADASADPLFPDPGARANVDP